MRLAALLLACALCALAFSINNLSAPVPDIEAPKQSHHVVYFWVCDDFIGALITTHPAIWMPVENGVPNDENVALMVEATAINVSHWYRGCLPPLRKKPEVST